MRLNLNRAGINTTPAATRNVRARNYATKWRMPRREFVAWNRDRLNALYASRRSAAKAIAADANVSHRTAEGYLSGRQAPGGLALAGLLTNNPEYAAEFRRLQQMETEIDPDFMEALVSAVTKRMRGE